MVLPKRFLAYCRAMPTTSSAQTVPTAGYVLERAVGYVRVSTAKQVDGHSLESQTAAIRAYCAARGLELVDIVVDAAESGRTPLADRDGGRRVLDAIYPAPDRVRVRRVARRADAVRHVVATKLDRLSRNVADAASLEERFRRDGVALHFTSQGLDTSTPFGQMVLRVLATLGEWEADEASRRTTEVRGHMRKRGMDCGGKPPFGWRREVYWDAEKQERQTRFEPVGEELRAIQNVLMLREAGCSIRDIVDALNADPKRYPPRGTKWHIRSVQLLIRAGDLKGQIHKLLVQSGYLDGE